jgi:hypothetical protein
MRLTVGWSVSLGVESPLSELVKSKSHCDWQSVSQSWCRASSGAHDKVLITVWQLRSCFCGAPSLTRGPVCLLYMLLVQLASAVFLGSKSLGTCEHILLSQISDLFFVASYDSQGHGGGIRPRLHTGISELSQSQRESHCDWQSVSQSVSQSVLVSSPIWGSWPDIYYFLTVTALFLCLLYMLLVLASAVFLGAEYLGTQTIFYCLRFETSLFVASYDSQGHGRGIQPRLHTGLSELKFWFSRYSLCTDSTERKQKTPFLAAAILHTHPPGRTAQKTRLAKVLLSLE